MEKRLLGYTKYGEKVDCYTLTAGELSVEILNYGGIIRSFTIQAFGSARDIALGFDDISGYETDTGYIGALVGRVANRIGNASYKLNGKYYQLEANNGPNCLHSGSYGYNRRIWDAQIDDGALALRLRDTGGNGGFPGKFEVEVRYTLSGERLIIEYKAVCDEDTPVSLTNHCYFNLGGHASGSIENHKITVFSNYITPVGDTLIPTGDLMDVANTPFDLRNRVKIGMGIDSDHPQIVLGGGYDHNFALSREPSRETSLAAVLEYDGLVLECLTTQPGIQFYSGNFLSGQTGKGGIIYNKRSGLCLETQNWPDAVNHSGFPDPILRKGDIYSHKTEYALRVANG
ncbi:MAG: galactose mutarotase [Oscillospiraceae bacterium]|nr:galactose mutarotase [Oscillospiraceae bacterium]